MYHNHLTDIANQRWRITENAAWGNRTKFSKDPTAMQVENKTLERTQSHVELSPTPSFSFKARMGKKKKTTVLTLLNVC